MTVAEIKKLALNNQVFNEAKALLEKGNVIFPKKFLKRKKIIIEVLDGKVFKVQINLKTAAAHLDCSCSNDKQNCVHIIAALLKYNDLKNQDNKEFDLNKADKLECKEVEILIENVSLAIVNGSWKLKIGFVINIDKVQTNTTALRFYCCDNKDVYFLHTEDEQLFRIALDKFNSVERQTLLIFDQLNKTKQMQYENNSLLFNLDQLLSLVKEVKKPSLFLLNEDKTDNILFLRSQHKINGLSHVCGFLNNKVFDFVSYNEKTKQIVLRLAYLNKFTDFKFPYNINIYKLAFGETLFFHFLIHLKMNGFKNIFFQSDVAIVKESEYLPKMFLTIEFNTQKNKFITDAFFKYKNKNSNTLTTVYPHRYYLAQKTNTSNFNRLLFYEQALQRFYEELFQIDYLRRFENIPIKDKNQIALFKTVFDDYKTIDLAELKLTSNLLNYKQLHFSISDIKALKIEDRQLKIEFKAGGIDLKLIKSVLSNYYKGNAICIGEDGWYDLNDENAKALISFWSQIDLRNATCDANNNLLLAKYHLFEVVDTISKYTDVTNLLDEKTALQLKIASENQFHLSLDNNQINNLRKYQKEGVKWIRALEDNQFGGILADEMGLGKTAQVIFAMLDSYQSTKSLLPSLIIVPASLLLNWKSEFQKFAPHVKIVTANGNFKERSQIYESLKNQILLMSFNVLRSDIKWISQKKFHYVVIDEAQGIKNENSTVTKAAKKIKGNFCLALTGTPIENRLLDLWSCFDFVLPNFLGNKKQFSDQFEKEKNDESFQKLMKKTSPFILRRTKNKVLKELPKKIITDIYVELSEEHQKLYDKQKTDGLKEIKESDAKNALNILSLILKLRHICSLVKDNDVNDFEDNSKANTALNIIYEALENKRKVILFTQFLDVIDCFKQTLKNQKIDHLVFDGRKTVKNRNTIIQKFNSAKEPCVMLASLKAGGVGINLTAAEVVIHFDVWWNSAVENQATDRAHRIGTSKTVQVYRIIAKNTIEERVCQVQNQKQELVKKTLVEDVNFFKSLSHEELLKLFE